MNPSDKEKIELYIKEADGLISSRILLADAYGKAVEILNEALKIDPGNIDVLNRKGNALNKDGGHKEALKISDDVLINDPKNIYALNNKGSSLCLLDLNQEALDIFDRVLEIDPKNIDARIGKGYALRKFSRYQEALKIYEEALRIDPTNESAQWNIRNVLQNITTYEELHDNREILVERVRKTRMGSWIEYASEELQNDRELVLEAVKQPGYGHALKFASLRLRNDREVVLAAVNSDGMAIQYASEALKYDRKIVLAALKADVGAYIFASQIHEGAFQYISQSLLNDREVVIEAVRHGSTLALVAPYFQDDVEIVRAAVNQNGYALEYASPRLRSNREVVLEAVKQNGNALVHASPSFGDDKEVVLVAIDSVPESNFGMPGSTSVILGCMSRRLRDDPNVNSCAVTNYNDIHLHWSEKFFNCWGLRELKKRQEEDWQSKYGAVNKDRLERWQRDLLQWQQNKKDIQFEGYNALRKEIEKMPAYQNWRKAVFEKFGRKCAMCGSTENLEIDHRWSFYSIVKHYGITNIVQAYECAALWDVNNGAPLCKTHHDQTTSSKYRAEKS